MKYGITYNLQGRRRISSKLFKTKAAAKRAIVQGKKIATNKRYKFHNRYKAIKNPRIFKAPHL